MAQIRRRQQELADFLRTRRARLAPGDVGLPEGQRRKTKGLRREEVAVLAGIGVTWYTRLEQGRDIQVSAEVLESIARVLRLDQEERSHLFLLARQHLPPALPPMQETVEPGLQRILDSFVCNPAYLAGRRWDLLAWNEAAQVIFGDFHGRSGLERNLIWLLFTRQEFRQLFEDWEGEAQQILAQFRASCACTPEDPWFLELVEVLHRDSREFHEWWSQHRVQARRAGKKTLQHPFVGKLLLEHSTFYPADTPDLKLFVYTPCTEEDRTKLQQLLEQQHTYS